MRCGRQRCKALFQKTERRRGWRCSRCRGRRLARGRAVSPPTPISMHAGLTQPREQQPNLKLRPGGEARRARGLKGQHDCMQALPDSRPTCGPAANPVTAPSPAPPHRPAAKLLRPVRLLAGVAVHESRRCAGGAARHQGEHCSCSAVPPPPAPAGWQGCACWDLPGLLAGVAQPADHLPASRSHFHGCTAGGRGGARVAGVRGA